MPRSQGYRRRITWNEIASFAPRIRNRVLSRGSIPKQKTKNKQKSHVLDFSYKTSEIRVQVSIVFRHLTTGELPKLRVWCGTGFSCCSAFALHRT